MTDTKTNSAEIARLRALCDAATPGPWHALPSVRSSGADVFATDKTTRIAEDAERADAVFVAAARTALPALLDEVERLTRGMDPERLARIEAATAADPRGCLGRSEALVLLGEVERLRAQRARLRDAVGAREEHHHRGTCPIDAWADTGAEGGFGDVGPPRPACTCGLTEAMEAP